MTQHESKPESRVTASVEKLKHEFERWVDAAVSQGGRALDVFGLRGGDRPFVPTVDVLESDDAVTIHVDLPGVDPAAVDVSLCGNMLTLKGEKALLTADSAGTVHLRERNCGPFERSIPLPAAVDSDPVEAAAKDGVLRIRFRKSKPSASRQIQIVTGKPTAPPPIG